jgi:hypothetical protein
MDSSFCEKPERHAESPFMKAERGKTARSVCAADGGKPFRGRLLRPDNMARLWELRLAKEAQEVHTEISPPKKQKNDSNSKLLPLAGSHHTDEAQ